MRGTFIEQELEIYSVFVWFILSGLEHAFLVMEVSWKTSSLKNYLVFMQVWVIHAFSLRGKPAFDCIGPGLLW